VQVLAEFKCLVSQKQMSGASNLYKASKMTRVVASFSPAVRPQRPAVAERPIIRENDDWDEDGVELRPLVDSARSDGDSAGTSTARQRNAALSYCCLMFMCCLGAQLATRVDPDAIRNSIPFITHSCDGKGCERTVMIQVSTPFVCSPSAPFFVLHAF
jgi:hypothetical protein